MYLWHVTSTHDGGNGLTFVSKTHKGLWAHGFLSCLFCVCWNWQNGYLPSMCFLLFDICEWHSQGLWSRGFLSCLFCVCCHWQNGYLPWTCFCYWASQHMALFSCVCQCCNRNSVCWLMFVTLTSTPCQEVMKVTMKICWRYYIVRLKFSS